MKIDQLSFYVSTAEQETDVKRWFGLLEAEWLYDTVTAISAVRGSREAQSVGLLQFNYSLGIELEILRYLSGPHWLQARPDYGNVLISHIGLHLADNEPWPTGGLLVQETTTIHHTNEHFHDPASPMYGRQYHYRIHELGPTSHVKYIRRLHGG